MRTDEAAKLFYDTTVKKATKYESIESAVLPRKGKDQTTKQYSSIFR